MGHKKISLESKSKQMVQSSKNKLQIALHLVRDIYPLLSRLQKCLRAYLKIQHGRIHVHLQRTQRKLVDGNMIN